MEEVATDSQIKNKSRNFFYFLFIFILEIIEADRVILHLSSGYYI
jgi:hypothetical protein